MLAIAWVLFIAAVYFPDLGRGFVKDDFTWIRAAKAAMAAPSTLALPQDVGFYRPAVTLTFIGDYALHGWHPRGYGWTNLALCALCAAALAGLALSLGLSRWAAGVAAFLWTVNPHGINMAVVWLSGRTALCLTLFCLLAACAFVRRWYVAAAVFLAMALASKEEAVMLPAILLMWSWLRADGRVPWRAIAAMTVPVSAYLLLRSFTPALTPATAPPFYRFTHDPLLLLRNIGEYFDRTTTLAAVVVAIAAIAFRMRLSLEASDKRVVAMMAVWWAGMLAITVWLPVRSSLYAVCPSAASAIVAAMMLDRMQAQAATKRRRWFEPVLAALLLAAIPIYQLRNDRWVEAARVSQRALKTISADAATLPHGGWIVLDDEEGISSFRNAFGDLAAEAMQTAFDGAWDARIASRGVSSSHASARGPVAAEYRMERGRISRVADPPNLPPSDER